MIYLFESLSWDHARLGVGGPAIQSRSVVCLQYDSL